METVMRDLSQARQSMTKTSQVSTILEAVGCDVDEVGRNVSYYQTSDVGTISIGGQAVKPGASLQINLRDQGVLMYLDRSCLVFDLDLPVALTNDFQNTQGVLKNAMALIQPLQIQLGSQSWGIGNGHKYAQFQLMRRKPKESHRRDRGLFLMDEGRSTLTPADVDVMIAASYQADVASTFTRQTDTKILKCVIPLKDLMAKLIDVPDDVIYLGLGQTLLINAKLNSAQDSIAPAQNQVIDYTIKNAFIMKVYTELTSEQEQRIMKSQISLPFNSIISQPRPMGPNINVTFNLGKNERLRRLVFGVCPTSGANTAVASNTAGRFFGVGGIPQWWSPNNFFPMVPFNYIQLSMNGFQVAINQYQIQSLSYAGAFSEDCEKWTDPWHSITNHCHVIDLTRFGITDDWYGSGNHSENVLQVEILYNPDTFLPYFGIRVPDADGLATFTFHSFVETQRKGELKHGIYVS